MKAMLKMWALCLFALVCCVNVDAKNDKQKEAEVMEQAVNTHLVPAIEELNDGLDPEEEHKLYQGGKCFCSPYYVGKIVKNIYKYDINSNLLIELNNYIIEGGFPRTMFFDDLNDKRTYVKGIVEEIFKKDIKSRCVIRKKETFDLVMNYIINNFGCTTSINNILKNLNKDIQFNFERSFNYA